MCTGLYILTVYKCNSLTQHGTNYTVIYVYDDKILGYEPADLTVHPPPELPRVG